MHRRGSVRLGTLLVAIVVTLLTALLGTTGRIDPQLEFTASPAVLASATPVLTAPVDDVPDAPPDTITDFYPESSNLSDCVGLVEKPGCGSGSRGGWRQTVVFVVLFAGLGVILWRVSRGIKANRAAIEADTDPSPDRS